MPIVSLPNGDSVDFPEGMSVDDMAAAIQDNFPEFSPDEGSALDQEQSNADPAEPKGIIASATNWVKDKLSIPKENPAGPVPDRVITMANNAPESPADNVPNATIAALPPSREEAGPGEAPWHTVVGVDQTPA